MNDRLRLARLRARLASVRSAASDAAHAATRARAMRVDQLIATLAPPMGATEGSTLAASDTTVTRLRGAANALSREQIDMTRRAAVRRVEQRRAERVLEAVVTATATERTMRARRRTIRPGAR